VGKQPTADFSKRKRSFLIERRDTSWFYMIVWCRGQVGLDGSIPAGWNMVLWSAVKCWCLPSLQSYVLHANCLASQSMEVDNLVSHRFQDSCSSRMRCNARLYEEDSMPLSIPLL